MDSGQDAAAEATPSEAAPADAGFEVPPWDPVWHKTTPAQWQAVPHDAMPDCGPGCTMLTRTELECGINRRPRASDKWLVYQAQGKVYAIDLAARTEWLIGDGSVFSGGYGAGAIAVDGEFVVYGVGGKGPAGGFTARVVASLTTGESKVMWGRSVEVGRGPSTSAFAYPFAYWDDDYGALHRFDLRDGTLKTVTVDGCSHQLSGSRTGLAVCAGAGGSELADFDKNIVRSLASVAYDVFDGSISQDGNTIVWVDTRDPGPNGEHGTWDAPFGGEIYTKSPPDFVAENRLTFDSPQHPFFKQKTWASDGDRIVWAQDTDSAAGSNWEKWDSTGGPVWYKLPGQAPRQLGFVLGCPQATSLGILGTWGTSLDNVGYVLVDYPSASTNDAGTTP